MSERKRWIVDLGPVGVVRLEVDSSRIGGRFELLRPPEHERSGVLFDSQMMELREALTEAMRWTGGKPAPAKEIP